MKKQWKLMLALIFTLTIVLVEKVPSNIKCNRTIISQAEKVPSETEPVTIVNVVDGDTLWVQQHGETYKIRMIGVNTPESVARDPSKNTKEGKNASDFTKNLLPEGTEVYLEYEEDLFDPYERILAYVWMTKDCDRQNYTDFRLNNVGALLLQETYCEAVCYAPNDKYKDWYEQLESEFQQETGN